MATGPQQKRKELREKRMKAEAAAKGSDKRQDMIKIVGAAAFIVVVGIAVVVGISLGGGDDSSKGSNEINELIAGIPQDGLVLGDPNAPVELVEFGDLRCPACKQASEEILPDVISGPVRNGKASLEFQNWAILGEDSVIAARAALAAAEQNRSQQFVENFYANQESESTEVTEDFLLDIAEKAGVPDIEKWQADRAAPRLDDVLLETDNLANESGFTGTPTFAIRQSDGTLQPINVTSSEDIIRAINQNQ